MLVSVSPFTVGEGSCRRVGAETLPCKHFVTFDAWRKLVHVGGGRSDKNWLSGLIQLEKEDVADPSRALIPHLRYALHLDSVDFGYRLYVHKKKAGSMNFNSIILL